MSVDILKSEVRIKPWKTILIIAGFPILYMIFGTTSIAYELFGNKNVDYYIPFWGGITIIHWLSVAVVVRVLISHGLSISDIGYKLKQTGTIKLIGGYLIVALVVFAGVEFLVSDSNLDSSKLNGLSGLIPKTTPHRIFFILLVFSTGFCEELVYRGFAITQLEKLGLNKWIAMAVAAFLFIGIHGYNAYFKSFFFYFGGGVMFGVVYLLSKRLLPSMLIHLAINLSAMLAILQI